MKNKIGELVTASNYQNYYLLVLGDGRNENEITGIIVSSDNGKGNYFAYQTNGFLKNVWKK